MTVVGEQYHPVDTGHRPGKYRVVSTGDPVVLLRVADGERRRINGGELLHYRPTR